MLKVLLGVWRSDTRLVSSFDLFFFFFPSFLFKWNILKWSLSEMAHDGLDVWKSAIIMLADKPFPHVMLQWLYLLLYVWLSETSSTIKIVNKSNLGMFF